MDTSRIPAPEPKELLRRARDMVPRLAERAARAEAQRFLPEGNRRRDAGGGLLPHSPAEALERL